MKLVHVYPYYGADLTGGAEVYEYELTQGLARLGADVEVLTTCTRRPQHTSAFSSYWPEEYPPDTTLEGAVTVRRFPVTFSVPAAGGYAVARAIFHRWRHEEALAQHQVGPHPQDPIAAFERAAWTRPKVFDGLITLARGPHSYQLRRALRRSRADIVFAGFVPFSTLWWATHIAHRNRTPTVVLPFFHPEDRYHHFAVFYRCFSAANAVLAQTPYSAELIRHLGGRAVEVGVGVDAGLRHDPTIDGARFRAHQGLRDARLALFVGRKEPAKRYDVAVDAIERLADPRAVLVLIGEDIDGRQVTSPRVRCLGRVSRAELLDAYDACDVFILPSEHESFGIVFLEAWMRGKPVLGNRSCRPVASVINDGVDGYLCSDAAEFSARMRELFDHPHAAAALGQAGQAKAVARYTWNAVTARVYELCTALVTGQRQARESDLEKTA